MQKNLPLPHHANIDDAIYTWTQNPLSLMLFLRGALWSLQFVILGLMCVSGVFGNEVFQRRGISGFFISPKGWIVIFILWISISCFLHRINHSYLKPNVVLAYMNAQGLFILHHWLDWKEIKKLKYISACATSRGYTAPIFDFGLFGQKQLSINMLALGFEDHNTRLQELHDMIQYRLQNKMLPPTLDNPSTHHLMIKPFAWYFLGFAVIMGLICIYLAYQQDSLSVGIWLIILFGEIFLMSNPLLLKNFFIEEVSTI